MSTSEDRSQHLGRRSRPKRLTTVPGLASLLADVSRERLEELAQIWLVPDPTVAGVAGLVYRQMIDHRQIEKIQASLGDAARLAFGRLASKSGPVRRSNVGKLVPFSDEALTAILGNLQHVGLAWKIQPTGKSDDLPEVWWFVPRDISRAHASAAYGKAPVPTSRDRELLETSAARLSVPEFVALSSEPKAIAEFEAAGEIIDRLLDGKALLVLMSNGDPGRVRDAARLGEALGVLEANGRAIAPGPRSVAWRNLPADERIRAMLRMWSVDEDRAQLVPPAVRRGVLAALRAAEPERWYDANAVARLAVSRSVPTMPAASSGLVVDARPVTIDRIAIDRAFETLAVIGVIALALDRRDRPWAMRLTDAGFGAIR